MLITPERKQELIRNSRFCNWMETLDGDGKPIVISDCGVTNRYSRGTKARALRKQEEVPMDTGEEPRVFCPYCGKYINFYNPLDECSWAIYDNKAGQPWSGC